MLILGKKMPNRILVKASAGRSSVCQSTAICEFSFQICKDQELHRGAVVELERQIGNFKNRGQGGMYILGKALSIKLKKKKNCMHSIPGLQKQALKTDAPDSRLFST